MTSFIFLAAAEGGGLGEMAAETARTFGLNWWLFLSQCISFAIVAFLLQKFAYQPILNVLEVRRRKIEEGLANAEKIKVQLAEAQATSTAIIQKANAEAQKMIEETRASAKALGERQAQQAVAEAEQIIAKAREASTQERDRLLAELRREVARLVIDTTTKVTGKVLTTEDQRRLSEEASREIAA
ncbi:MAG TPA: F0F1 ATP synthase subunit B [Chthoniobacteraceae bacterium]|jgi:F-type H+-transporting ATPase subunit b